MPTTTSSFPTDAQPPGSVFGYVAVREPRAAADVAAARDSIATAGLEVLAASRLGFAVVGSAEAYTRITGASFQAVETLMHGRGGHSGHVTHFDLVGPGQPDELGLAVPAAGTGGIQSVLVERPRSAHAIFPSPTPPDVARYHLRVPEDVATLTGAVAAHDAGWTGQGVTVAMVDTGFYRHPYFAAHGYDLAVADAVIPFTSAGRDPLGHGTGECANVFAVAPGASLRGYRAANDAGKLVAPLAGFMRAKAADPRPGVISCSWGGDEDYPPARPGVSAADAIMAAEIEDAIAQGIVVVFSAGNGGFSIEAQVEGVISAGGAHIDEHRVLTASDYASAYESPFFAGVTVPTVCGLVGMQPRASYLLLPVPPGCPIDAERAAPQDGDPADGTGPGDGWALFSGTSAAAPQVAGAAALLLHASPGASPADVREALCKTAVDVDSGRCFARFDHQAAPQPDVATGFGLIDAGAATRWITGAKAPAGE